MFDFVPRDLSARPLTIVRHTNQPPGVSYRRVSSETQVDGDGLRRQTDEIEDYAAEIGVEIVAALEDRGVSALSGANLIEGRLGEFVAGVFARPRTIPEGTHLFVEALDRISRLDAASAGMLLNALVARGIIIHTVADREIYSAETFNAQPWLLMKSNVHHLSAHEDIKHRVFRQVSTWAEKRENLSPNNIPTRRVPGWLKAVSVNGNDKAPFRAEIIPERAEVVRRIFVELASGIGRGKIAQRLNRAGIPPFGHGVSWHGGTIQKLTDTKAVLGYFQPHKLEKHRAKNNSLKTVRVPVGSPVKIFDAAIDDELYHRALSRVHERAQPVRNAAGRKGRYYSNIFTGLTFCNVCRKPMVYRPKHKRGINHLQCSGFRTGTCNNNTRYHYEPLESAILDWTKNIDLSEVVPEDARRIELKIATARTQSELITSQIVNLLTAFDGAPTRMAADRIREKEIAVGQINAEMAELEAELAKLRTILGPTGRATIISEMPSRLAQASSADELYEVRANVRQALADIVTQINFEPAGRVTIIVCNGIAAARYEAGAVVSEVHLYAQVGTAPGCIRPEAFGNAATVERLVRLKAAG